MPLDTCCVLVVRRGGDRGDGRKRTQKQKSGCGVPRPGHETERSIRDPQDAETSLRTNVGVYHQTENKKEPQHQLLENPNKTHAACGRPRRTLLPAFPDPGCAAAVYLPLKPQNL